MSNSENTDQGARPVAAPRRARDSSKPLEPEVIEQIVALHGEGLGRNAIARQLGVAYASVTRYCREHGLEFDTEKSALAVRAQTLKLAEARAELGSMMVLAAKDMLEQIDAPAVMIHYQQGNEVNVGGFVEHTLDQPTFSDQRQIMTMAGIAFDKATKLLEKNTGARDEALGLLDVFGDTLKAAAATLRGSSDEPEYGTPDSVTDTGTSTATDAAGHDTGV